MFIDTLITGIEAGNTTNPFVLVEYCKQGAMAQNIVMRRDLASWKDGQQLVATYLWHNRVADQDTIVRVVSALDHWLDEKREELLELVLNFGHVYVEKYTILYSQHDIIEEQATWEESHKLKRFNFKVSPFWIVISEEKDGITRAPLAIFDRRDLGDFFRYQL